MRKNLKTLKNGKAVTPDDMPVDVWKCLVDTKLSNLVLDGEKMPEEWR